MSRRKFTRRQIARELGISYSLVRVYENALGDLLNPWKGANRTTFYGIKDFQTFIEAAELRRQGHPFQLLRFSILRARQEPYNLSMIEKKIDAIFDWICEHTPYDK